ncbi:COQ9 family protein [Sandarakinorhabdus sp.]|uniref:COQ9 family protein n=1 Tax=Sandarakinorhabdus sp. TaxID=1916663 RepID=UPI00286E587B|nr:COQ9 family protein [Sandarakinorhabdus sp.]
MTDDLPLAELRPRLIAAMLPHIAFDGWSDAARDGAALDAGIDRDIAAMALSDAAAMLDAWTARTDAVMTQAMVAGHNMKIRDRIKLALTSRLAANDREATRRALALLAQPQHAGLSARLLWRSADAMWRAAGDTATDYNHYTKRAILSGIYAATLLFWIDDDSADAAATMAFIDRRIDGVMRFEKAKARIGKLTANLPDPARFLGRLRYPAV